MKKPTRKPEYDKAVKDAAKLANSLGPTWKPNVWENLGWHYSAVSPCGRLKVHPMGCGIVGFTAFLDHDGGPGGIWIGQAESAADAVRAAVGKAESEAMKIMTTLEAIGDLVY